MEGRKKYPRGLDNSGNIEGNSNGLFHRPRAPTPCRATWPPSPLVLGAGVGPHAQRRLTGTRGEPLASARRSRQQVSATGHGPDGGPGDGEPARELRYTHGVRTVRCWRLVGAKHHVVLDTRAAVEQVLAPPGWQINTAFVEASTSPIVSMWLPWDGVLPPCARARTACASKLGDRSISISCNARYTARNSKIYRSC